MNELLLNNSQLSFELKFNHCTLYSSNEIYLVIVSIIFIPFIYLPDNLCMVCSNYHYSIIPYPYLDK